MATNGNDRAQQTPRTELARTLLAIADPIRLRMLNLMFAGELSPEQFVQILGVDERTISRHLVLFRESKTVSMRTKRNAKFYTLRAEVECPHIRLLRIAIELLADDSVLNADVRVFYAVHQLVPQSQQDGEDPHSNPIERLRLAL